MTRAKLVVCQDLKDLYRKVAGEFVRLARESVRATGRFVTALSGGATPKGLYSLLAATEFQEQIPWSQVHLFWGDERCVSPEHPESNYRLVRETLLSKIAIPAESIHRMAGELDPPVAAIRYEDSLKEFFNLVKDQPPRFDLILLGLGDDGHTASLFPGSAALNETRSLVASLYVEKLMAHRLTLTLPVLNQAANVLFLVAGKNKANILRNVLQKRGASKNLPAQLVQPVSGRLIWFADQAAARSC
ncbi:MAG: 6-phosphogluconolactonase [Candidatus Binatia bacterium]